MILDFEYISKTKKLLISEINSDGDIELKYYPWSSPKKYVVCDECDPEKHPKYHTWDNKPVKLVYSGRPNRFSIYEFMDRLPEHDRERMNAFQTPKIYFVDIETEILEDGFVEPINANSKVLTLTIVYDRKVLSLGIKPLKQKEIVEIKEKIENHFSEVMDLKVDFKYISFHDRVNPEKEMMLYFFEKMVPRMPVISGWNFLAYDWTFLINRCRRIGIDPNISSFTKSLENIFGTIYEVPAHRLVIDYMELYKKWDTSIKVKEQNSLNWVGERILNLAHGAKVSYSGNLQDLYNNDFCKYVFYNAVDTMLCQLIHEKMQYINIAFSVANLARIRLCDFAYKNLNTTLVTTEGFLREEFRNQKNIVFCRDDENVDLDSIPGGFVKPPNKGMNEWVAIFDFASLYPTTQRQFGISPETFKGFVCKKDRTKAEYNGKIVDITDNDVVCVNDAVFSRDESVTVKFLEHVYSERQRFKGLMKVENKKIDNLKKTLKELKEELELLENS